MATLRIVVAALLLAVAIAAGAPARAAPEAAEQRRIDALIAHVEHLDGATFIRNGREYGPGTAATFMRRKLKQREDEVRTALDFIEKVASVSSTSGKPYEIRLTRTARS